MNALTVEIYARVYALNAEIELAKVANAERERNGYAPAYGEEAFDDIRNRLEGLANQLREAQLDGRVS